MVGFIIEGEGRVDEGYVSEHEGGRGGGGASRVDSAVRRIARTRRFMLHRRSVFRPSRDVPD